MPDARPMTVDQVAEYVQLSHKTVMRAIRAGHLEASQLTQGRTGWRVWPAAIPRWMEVRSNLRGPRPLASVHAVGVRVERARREGAGGLRVEPGMGRDNA